MSVLASSAYDPAVAVNKETSALLAMTAIDTTNLRVKFKAPVNGSVAVRLKGQATGAITAPRLLFGILEGATVKARMTPFGAVQGLGSTSQIAQEANFLITGLTPGVEYTWDAAYGVEVAVASTSLRYGGPNNATVSDAYGAFSFEVWSTPGLLAGKFYDPVEAVTKSTTALLAMTALDTTNLRHKFVAPASGRVLWRGAVPVHGGTGFGILHLGILEGATLKAKQMALLGNATTQVANSAPVLEASSVISGLTPGTEYTWDIGYGVEGTTSATGLKYGGPNDTTENNAFGGIAFEIWSA